MIPRVVIAHDHLVQRGGAERVALAMHRAFPSAPIVTAFYEPDATYSEFADLDIRTLAVDRVRSFRRDHRRSFPFLPAVWSALHIKADVVLCSSAGWSHGLRTSGTKIVYCHSPARWLYPFAQVHDDIRPTVRFLAHRVGPAYRAWDRRAAATAQRYLANSAEVQRRIQHAYGRYAEILHPPVTLPTEPGLEPIPGLKPDFSLVASRLLGYKNVDVAIDAFRRLPDEHLVIVGAGPMGHVLATDLPSNVSLLGSVSDAQLRWLYQQCRLLVAPGYEDFGLTPIEAAAAGRPTVALRWGGYLETVVDGVTGLFVERADPDLVAKAVIDARSRVWDSAPMRAHAAQFSLDPFVNRLRAVVDEVTEPLHQVAEGIE